MEYGVVAIVVACLFVLMIGIVKQKFQIFFYFCVRMVLGVVSIYFCNDFLNTQGISVSVGINPISALTTGILGISGFALLYGIMFYRLL